MNTSRNSQVIEFEQATNYRRLAARIIDTVLVGFILLPISAGLSVGAEAVLGTDSTSDTAMWLFYGTFFLLVIAYDTLMHRFFGKTVGKMLLGMRVVNANGEKLSLGWCITRAIMLYVSGIFIVALTAITASIFGWIFIGGLKRYRRFPHDSMSESFVVLESKGQLKKATAPQEVLVGPAAEHERLHTQGLIGEDEYQRKRSEIRK